MYEDVIMKKQSYQNKTKSLLVPCLKVYDKEFLAGIAKLNKVSYGIFDYILNGSTISGRNIFILLNTKGRRILTQNVINSIKSKDYYVTDYICDIDISKQKYHMLVIKIPEEFNDSYDYFLKGEYSKMYTPAQMLKIFGRIIDPKVVNILKKNSKSYTALSNKIFKAFASKIAPEELTHMETDFPLVLDEETYNYNLSYRKFFDIKLDKVWGN